MRVLLDENLEHEVLHRLENYGHECLHVGRSDGLSKGDSDEDLAAVSKQDGRVIVTYDDDFRTEFAESDYHAVLFFPDETLSARNVADAVHEISTHYDSAQLGFQAVGQSWL